MIDCIGYAVSLILKKIRNIYVVVACLRGFFWESKNKGLSQTAPFMVRRPIVFLMIKN